jgi:hypothetical protein
MEFRECTSQPKAHDDLTAVSDGYGKSDAHLPTSPFIELFFGLKKTVPGLRVNPQW